MSTQSLKLSFFFLIALTGAVGGYFDARHVSEPSWWFWTSTILVNATIFFWYIRDSSERSVVRNKWLNIGVVAAAPIAVPIYILRRPVETSRLRVVLSMCGYLVLFMAISILSGLLGSFAA